MDRYKHTKLEFVQVENRIQKTATTTKNRKTELIDLIQFNTIRIYKLIQPKAKTTTTKARKKLNENEKFNYLIYS